MCDSDEVGAMIVVCTNVVADYQPACKRSKFLGPMDALHAYFIVATFPTTTTMAGLGLSFNITRILQVISLFLPVDLDIHVRPYTIVYMDGIE